MYSLSFFLETSVSLPFKLCRILFIGFLSSILVLSFLQILHHPLFLSCSVHVLCSFLSSYVFFFSSLLSILCLQFIFYVCLVIYTVEPYLVYNLSLRFLFICVDAVLLYVWHYCKEDSSFLSRPCRDKKQNTHRNEVMFKEAILPISKPPTSKQPWLRIE